MSAATKGKGAAIAAALAYVLLWGGATAYLYATGGDWSTGVAVIAIFGLGLGGVAWLLTRGADAPRIEVKRPAVESGAIIVYLALYAVLFLGFGMTWARQVLPAGQQQELLVMGLKLGVHIVLPALLLMLLGAKLGPITQLGLSGRKFWRTFIVLGLVILALVCVITPSLKQISGIPPTFDTMIWAVPLGFIWITLEAGACEEFLFRGILQTRLTSWCNSAWAGVIVTSLIFGLAHAPGLFMRGGPDVDGWSTDPLQVIAHTIAVLSPIGLTFGLIYARTKSLLLVILLHGLVDVLPSLAEFVQTWR
ncbi:MAG: CPBP family intramembrane metalloprotease [Alphaproteobacteria bacterium]|nr:CPBP family intramembrane metalloprotease [Alphaproteobacteria bacterium]